MCCCPIAFSAGWPVTFCHIQKCKEDNSFIIFSELIYYPYELHHSKWWGNEMKFNLVNLAKRRSWVVQLFWDNLVFFFFLDSLFFPLLLFNLGLGILERWHDLVELVFRKVRAGVPWDVVCLVLSRGLCRSTLMSAVTCGLSSHDLVKPGVLGWCGPRSALCDTLCSPQVSDDWLPLSARSLYPVTETTASERL